MDCRVSKVIHAPMSSRTPSGFCAGIYMRREYMRRGNHAPDAGVCMPGVCMRREYACAGVCMRGAPKYAPGYACAGSMHAPGVCMRRAPWTLRRGLMRDYGGACGMPQSLRLCRHEAALMQPWEGRRDAARSMLAAAGKQL
jgi:hypothetical protein